MSSSVARLTSGDIIQVRTGVLQGIGPQGPVGPVGPIGEEGPQGSQGVPGPMGQIDDLVTMAHSSGSSQPVGTATPTALNLTTSVRDDAGLITALTQLTLPDGNWYLQASVTFEKPSGQSGAGWRRISVVYDGVEYDAVKQNAIVDSATEFALRTLVVAPSPGRVATFMVEHSDPVSIGVWGRFWVTKLGPGAQGPAGVAGPQGPVGQIGPVGPQGVPGTLVSNSTTFEQIGG